MPPHILKRLLEAKDKDVRQAALNTLLATARMRGMRQVRAGLTGLATGTGTGQRTIFDLRHSEDESGGTVVRTETGPASADASVNRAFDGLGTTRDFYKTVLGRNSIDDHGMNLLGKVHYANAHNNAFWDGKEMVFGDGDGVIFTDFTKSLDVIGHELTHGVTEFTANLAYQNQSGALNESISDVFGSLIKQWSKKQTADDADWLIGAEIFTPTIGADALRSMKAPGTAYDNTLLGKDPQPDHMDHFVHMSGDNGGVHYNSGIPNKAFYLTAKAIGGYAFDAPGHIWYESLRASHEATEFQGFADTTYSKALQLYGPDEQAAIVEAWKEVGIRISGVHVARRTPRVSTRPREDESLAEMTKRFENLSGQMNMLQRELSSMKGSSNGEARHEHRP